MNMKYQKELNAWMNGEQVQYRSVNMGGLIWDDIPSLEHQTNSNKKQFFLNLNNWFGDDIEFRIKPAKSNFKKIRLALMCSQRNREYYLLSISEEDDLYGIPTYVDFVKWVTGVFAINFDQLIILDRYIVLHNSNIIKYDI